MPGPKLPKMEQLVEWRALDLGPTARALGVPTEVHALVDGDLLSLCGHATASDLSQPVATGQTVCPWCAEIGRQIALGLIALLPTHPATQANPTQED